MFFAAKNAADRKLAEQKKRIREEGLAQGRTEGRSQERERIIKKLESSGNFTPEIARILNGETDADS